MHEIEMLEEICGYDVNKSQKSRDGFGEEYRMTGRNIGNGSSCGSISLECKDAEFDSAGGRD